MRLFQKLVSFAIVSGSLLAAVTFTQACSSSGGSSSASGPGAVSSVESAKTAGSLTDAEAKQYCEDSLRYNKAQIAEADTKKIGCGLGAAIVAAFGAKTDAEAKTKCAEAYNACLAKPATTTPDAGPAKDPCATAKADLKDCSATIAELNTCTADSAALFKTLVGKDFCADAKVATASDGGTSGASSPFEQPASCKALQTKCPNLYKSGG